MSRALRDLLRHAPKGRAWPRDEDSTFVGKILASVAPSFDRVEDAVASFLQEMLPSKAVEHIDRWEEALGLSPPDFPLASPEALLAARQLFAQSFIRRAPLSPQEIERVAALFTSNAFDSRIYRLVSVNKSGPHTATINLGSSDGTIHPFLTAYLEALAPLSGSVTVNPVTLPSPFAGITSPADGYVHTSTSPIFVQGTYGEHVDGVSIIFADTGNSVATATLDGAGGWTANVPVFSNGFTATLFPRAIENAPGGGWTGDGVSVDYTMNY